MKCFVITHPGAQTLDDCVQSLERYQWDYEIYPAVDGWRLTAQDWESIGVQLGGGKIGRRPGAQGCWHSHFHLWKRCIDLDHPMAILECDALVTGPWPGIDCSTGLIKLYKNAVCKTHPVFGRWSKGSHAYVVSPEQASSLITFSRESGAEALDKHLGDKVVPWRFYQHDLVVLNPRRGRSTTSSANPLW